MFVSASIRFETILLIFVSELRDILSISKKLNIACECGIGLSWGSVFLEAVQT